MTISKTLTGYVRRNYQRVHLACNEEGIASGCDEPSPDLLSSDDRFALVQSSRDDGRIWLSVHPTIGSVLSYVIHEEGADDWNVDRVVDLYTDEIVTLPDLPGVWDKLVELTDITFDRAGGGLAFSDVAVRVKLELVLTELGLADGSRR